MACTKRKAPDATAMVATPPSRKRRRPTRSSTAALRRRAARPAPPLVPITSPIVRSEPPSARTCSGRRKKEANVRKKKKFAAVTRTKRGVSSRASAAGAPACARGASIGDATPCRARRHIIHAAHGDRTTTRAAAPAQAPPRAAEAATPRPGARAPPPAREDGVGRPKAGLTLPAGRLGSTRVAYGSPRSGFGLRDRPRRLR